MGINIIIAPNIYRRKQISLPLEKDDINTQNHLIFVFVEASHFIVIISRLSTSAVGS